MKVSLFLSSLWIFIAALFSPVEKAVLTGIVKDQEGEALVGARVFIKKDRQVLKGVITDINGKYRLEIEPGLYDIEFAYTGCVTHRITGVPLVSGKENNLDNVLEISPVMDEVILSAYKTKETPYGAMGAAPASAARSVDKAKGTEPERPATYAGAKRKTTAKSGEGKAAKPAPAAPPGESAVDGGVVTGVGSHSKEETYSVDGISMKDALRSEPAPKPAMSDGMAKKAEPTRDADTYEEKADISDDEAPASGTPAQPAPRAGLLTAGEWNDLHNWNRHWVDLLTDGETDSYQKTYGFYPRQRYTVLLTNENKFPIADAVAQLKSADGKIIWEARTDNTGKAELWAALFSPEKETARLHAEIWVNGKKYPINTLKSATEGFNNLEVRLECNAPKNVDIVWAVDATGSMGDEIEYLKTELLDVIGRAKSRNPELSYRMGTVFYRDKGDEYITKSSGLSPDIANTVEFIQKQFAGGGGDYPEAVHSALEEAIYGQKWSENAVARICFLVLDASPHQEPEVIASIQKSIREAARLGIRIVPIAASGIQKDTEFLLKFFGLATNGTYVFLTDHSGIGGKHLEPTTDEYKVEPLNNLLVRLITEYTSIPTCEGKSEIRFENDPQQQPGPVMQALYYPNPATDQFTLELPFEVQSVTIYDSEGKAVRKLEKPVAGPNVVLINDLAAGFYTIRISNNGLMQSGKLMVVRS